jgi:hypothetical protein
MTYRRELESAHARITQLEDRLAEKEKRARATPPLPKQKRPFVPKVTTIPAPAPAPRVAPLPLRHAWPIALLVVCLTTYAIRFGVSLPSRLVSDSDFWRAGLLSAGGGAALMSLRYALWARNDGEGSVLQRLLLIAAVIVAAPVLIAALIFGMPLFSIGMGVFTLGFSLWMLVRWVRTGATD